ncbi:MAG: tryptophan synthase subunit alpha [Phycisphaerales bacterium]|nr:tryptophan synthase subunit alpha [Phycisphaerales bacterium]
MNRINQAFVNAKETGQGALLPFVCAGSPELEALPRLLPALESAGASVVEIGFPYSDPIADGPTIAAAMHVALQQGITPEKIFEQVSSVRDQLSMGLVAMVSVSIVIAMGGPDAFVKRAVEAGFDGFIFPDVSFEETETYREACKAHGATMSLLISPTTPTERAIEIANASSGFAYLLARSGVTGERSDLPDIGERVRSIRSKSSTPIACGFGISNADQVGAVIKHADGAIVGSALVRTMIDATKNNRDYVGACEEFVHELAMGLISMDSI